LKPERWVSLLVQENSDIASWLVCVTVSSLDVVYYYLVASSVLPLLHFGESKKIQIFGPLTFDQNLEETRNKNVFSSNDRNEQLAVKA
jgi:hypothetical protein